MLRLWINIFALLCALIVISCGFIDLRQIGMEIEPGITDFVLPEPYSPVILKFDTEMIKNDTEGILQINSDLGAIRGDKIWEGNHLYFIPVQAWTAGVRYTLNLIGTIRSVDGRESRIEHFISFYAINKNTPPLLQLHSPSAGASTGINDVVLEFHFSQSMDRLSVESALTIDGVGNKTFEWLADDQILKVIPQRALSPWTLYRWNLRDLAKCINGVPLPKIYSGFFITDLDQKLPKVKNVFPVLNANGFWYPTGLNIETGLGQGQAIAVEFDKPMGPNALSSLRFDPSLAGRAEFLSENSIVYIFSRDPDPQTIYTLTVSGDTRDSEGLKIGDDFKITFVPDIPFLNILSFTSDGVVNDITSLSNNALPVYVDPVTGQLNISFHFSLMLDFEEKQNTPQRITLNPFFPRTLTPTALQYVYWISDDRLFMRWEGLTAGDAQTPHYYRITIPSGRNGINSGSGNYMKEDIIIYLEAVGEK